MCMTDYTFDTITEGESWACQFRVTVFCDEDGNPCEDVNLQPGESHPGTPQEYVSLGVIHERDTDKGLLRVQDTKSNWMFVVDKTNTWAYDRVEFVPVED